MRLILIEGLQKGEEGRASEGQYEHNRLAACLFTLCLCLFPLSGRLVSSAQVLIQALVAAKDTPLSLYSPMLSAAVPLKCCVPALKAAPAACITARMLSIMGGKSGQENLSVQQMPEWSLRSHTGHPSSMTCPALIRNSLQIQIQKCSRQNNMPVLALQGSRARPLQPPLCPVNGHVPLQCAPGQPAQIHQTDEPLCHVVCRLHITVLMN